MSFRHQDLTNLTDKQQAANFNCNELELCNNNNDDVGYTFLKKAQGSLSLAKGFIFTSYHFSYSNDISIRLNTSYYYYLFFLCL